MLVKTLLAILALMLAPGCHNRGELAARRADVATRSEEVMPFDLERSTHVFEKVEDGGVQRVVSDDGDPLQVERIREHLSEEAVRFARGDFHDPQRIHGEHMPGLHALVMGYERMSVDYSEIDRGAQIRYRSHDRTIIAAIHEWFDAQLADHGRHAHPRR